MKKGVNPPSPLPSLDLLLNTYKKVCTLHIVKHLFILIHIYINLLWFLCRKQFLFNKIETCIQKKTIDYSKQSLKGNKTFSIGLWHSIDTNKIPFFKSILLTRQLATHDFSKWKRKIKKHIHFIKNSLKHFIIINDLSQDLFYAIWSL